MPIVVQALAIGILQGLTEFLPISSSAHLIVVPRLLGWNDAFLNGASFDVMLHAGTLLALVAYLWRDLVRLLGAWLASIHDRRIGVDPDRRLAWLAAATVIPGAVLGVAFERFFDTYFREHLLFVAVFLALGAGMLWAAEQLGIGRRQLDHVDVRDAAVIGVAQALALFPGLSRSGTTIAAGMYSGLTREAAARFSFLIGVPIIGGAAALKGVQLVTGGVPAADALPLAAGMAGAAVAGLVAIAALLAYLRGHGTAPFIVERLALAAGVFVYLLAR